MFERALKHCHWSWQMLIIDYCNRYMKISVNTVNSVMYIAQMSFNILVTFRTWQVVILWSCICHVKRKAMKHACVTVLHVCCTRDCMSLDGLYQFLRCLQVSMSTYWLTFTVKFSMCSHVSCRNYNFLHDLHSLAELGLSTLCSHYKTSVLHIDTKPAQLHRVFMKLAQTQLTVFRLHWCTSNPTSNAEMPSNHLVCVK